MTTITIKGREYTPVPIRDSFDRRAQQSRNTIMKSLSRFSLTEDDIDVDLEPARRSVPASVTFFLGDHRCYYSCAVLRTYADNLALVARVIDAEVQAVLRGEQPMEDFITKFVEIESVEEERLKARETLGVAADEKNLDVINKAYKALAKELHPDTDTGDIEKFKVVNNAHKTLKRELS
jgi:hypothetical protein